MNVPVRPGQLWRFDRHHDGHMTYVVLVMDRLVVSDVRLAAYMGRDAWVVFAVWGSPGSQSAAVLHANITHDDVRWELLTDAP